MVKCFFKQSSKRFGASKLSRALMCALLFMPAVAFAQNNDFFSVGTGAISMPEYEGSDEQQLRGFPAMRLQKGAWSFDLARGLRYEIESGYGFRYGPSLGYFIGRQEKDSAYLRGMGDIDYSAVAGLFVAKSLGTWQFDASVRRDFASQSEGTRWVFMADKLFVLSQSQLVNITARATWMDQSYADAFFGVSQEQAVNTGYQVFEARSGVKHVGISGYWIYMFATHWQTVVGVDTAQLLGDNVDSPIVFSSSQTSVFGTLSYRF